MIPAFRCSSLDRVLLCPGSMTLVPLVAPRKGAEGDEGTFLHWLAHSKLKAEHGATGELGPSPAIPKTINFCAWIADYYVRFVRDNAPPDWSLECEVAMAYDFDGFSLSGHVDSVAVNTEGTEAIGFDLKTGRDPVDPADNNEQILGYSILLLRAYPDLKKITFWIVQPCNDEDEGFERCSSVVIEGALLASATASLEQRLKAAIVRKMEVETSRRACKWCSGAMQCPAAIAERELMKATLTLELLEKIKAVPDDAELAKWVIAGRTLSRPLEDADKMLRARIAENGQVLTSDGLPITTKTSPGSYEITQPLEFYNKLTAELPPERVAACIKPSITKLREEIAEQKQIPVKSSKGASATAYVAGEFGPYMVQRERTILVFP